MVKTFIALLFLATAAFAANKRLSLSRQRANKCYTSRHTHYEKIIENIYEAYRTNGTITESEAKIGRELQGRLKKFFETLALEKATDEEIAQCYTICTGGAVAVGRYKTACFFGGLLILKANGIRKQSIALTELEKNRNDFAQILDALPTRPDPTRPPPPDPFLANAAIILGFGCALYAAPLLVVA